MVVVLLLIVLAVAVVALGTSGLAGPAWARHGVRARSHNVRARSHKVRARSGHGVRTRSWGAMRSRPVARDHVYEDSAYERAVLDDRPVVYDPPGPEPVAPTGNDEMTGVMPVLREPVVVEEPVVFEEPVVVEDPVVVEEIVEERPARRHVSRRRRRVIRY